MQQPKQQQQLVVALGLGLVLEAAAASMLLWIATVKRTAMEATAVVPTVGPATLMTLTWEHHARYLYDQQCSESLAGVRQSHMCVALASAGCVIQDQEGKVVDCGPCRCW